MAMDDAAVEEKESLTVFHRAQGTTLPSAIAEQIFKKLLPFANNGRRAYQLGYQVGSAPIVFYVTQNSNLCGFLVALNYQQTRLCRYYTSWTLVQLWMDPGSGVEASELLAQLTDDARRSDLVSWIDVCPSTCLQAKASLEKLGFKETSTHDLMRLTL